MGNARGHFAHGGQALGGNQLALRRLQRLIRQSIRQSQSGLLRERVTSKGGTTHAALTSMEQSGVKGAIVAAVKAAARRGKEMGDELGAAA